MNTIKTSLFALAIFAHASVHAQCGCGGYPAPSPLPLPLPLPLPSPLPLPLPLPLPAPTPCATPAPPAPPAPAPPAPAPLPPKPRVYINRQQPIVINRKQQSFVINAGSPVVVKPAPVIIQKPGQSEYRPYVQTVTSAPIIVDKKIIKIERPIVKKYYQETYSQTHPAECGQTIPLPPVLPSPCDNVASGLVGYPSAPAVPAAPLPAPIAIQPSASVPDDISALLSSAGLPSAVVPTAGVPCGCSSY